MNNSVRICHVTSAHKSNDIRIFQKECKSLAKQKAFDVYLVAQGLTRKEDGVKVIGVGQNNRGRLYRIFCMSTKIYRTAKALKADVYHLHDPELLLYARRLKKKNNVVIFDSHENYSQQIAEKSYIPIYFRKAIASLYKMYETYVVKRIDAVVIPCTTSGRNPFWGRSNETILLNNYPILDDKRGYIRKKSIGGNNSVKVCYTGSISENRGITKLVKACYKANVKLILAGAFSSEEYKTQIMRMKEAVCIDYRGICDYDSVTKIYRESDIGAAILLKVGQYATMENLPTKTYEYMQVGLPIIMSDTDYNKKLMKKHDFAYLVNPENEEDIVRVIDHIVNNCDEVVKKTELAHELIQNQYNWDTDFKKLYVLYKKLIKRIKC